MKWYTTAKTLKMMRVTSLLKGAREEEKEDSSYKIDLCNDAVKERYAIVRIFKKMWMVSTERIIMRATIASFHSVHTCTHARTHTHTYTNNNNNNLEAVNTA